MEKIYVVTEGSYSDYHIVAVYDEAHKSVALAHVQAIGEQKAFAEEWTLNEGPMPEHGGRLPYRVHYSTDRGGCFAVLFPDEWRDDIDKSHPDCWRIWVRANTPKHAAKIAMERATHEKALNGS